MQPLCKCLVLLIFVVYLLILCELLTWSPQNILGEHGGGDYLYFKKYDKPSSVDINLDKVKIHSKSFIHVTEVDGPNIREPGDTNVNKFDIKQSPVTYRKKETSNKWNKAIKIGELRDKNSTKLKTKGPKIKRKTDVIRSDIKIRNDWQPVDDPATLFVFSGYFDDKSKHPVIRIIGISLRNRTQPYINCRFTTNTPDGPITYRREGYIRGLPEDKGLKYFGVFVICKIKPDDRPSTVSVSLKTQESMNKIRISYPDPPQVEFAVCFPAVTSKYNNIFELVQTVEMARILGAQKFYIYDHGAPPEIRRILHLYRQQGLFEVIEWKLPVFEIHYFGQLVAVNDCLYRNVGITKYVLFMDLDEMVIPRQHSTWLEMMKVLDKEKGGYSTFYFQMSYFHKEWEDVYDRLEQFKLNQTELVKKFRIQLLSKIWREEQIQKVKYRSKYFVRPEKVETLAIHVVYTYRDRSRFNAVDPKIAIVQHYRLRGNHPARVLDWSARRFTKPLINMVGETWLQLMEED
ncbi:uncharacterized protein LOC126818293 [Patella vulgata]|uniref:uncharacterized protein LOC126818293 n=1 Tax=Patella vulgata TaxID=6465 RepID=UPI00217FA682|nr:uncharacterized protein LOC126818293 [Patella vulgata]